MRMISYAVLAALVVAPVAASAATPLQLETSMWSMFKNKQANAFGAMFTPNYVGVYEVGTASRAKELDSLKNSKIASFKINDFSSRMIDAGEDMLTTYSVDVKGTMGKTDVSGRYWVASVWHRTGNKWLTAYHTEIKAK
jgi:hypothetical protein